MRFFLLFLFWAGSLFAQDIYVNGYYRVNGTYVQGHYRTAPNYTINDNYSTVGNINPYTGKAGTVPRESNAIQYPTYITNPINVPTTYNTNPTLPPLTTPVMRETPKLPEIKPTSGTSSPQVKGGKYFSNNNGKRNYVTQIL